MPLAGDRFEVKAVKNLLPIDSSHGHANGRGSGPRMEADAKVMQGLTTPLARITHTSLADECYRVLRGNILSLNLRPGSPLDEVQLAANLGISKTPVRETIARLAGEGLITSGPSRKSYVARLSAQTIAEVAAIRTILEAGSLLELTPRLTDEILAQLAESHQRASSSVRAEDVDTFLDSNNDFHMLLIEQTGNETLRSVMHGLIDQAARVSAAIFLSGDQDELIAVGIESHAMILAALFDRDAERAAAQIRKDIRMTRDAALAPGMHEKIESLNYDG